jgi:hypothetical protein
MIRNSTRIEHALGGLGQVFDEAPAHDDDQQHGADGAQGQQDFAGQITEDDQTRHSRVVRLRRPNKQTEQPARRASEKDARIIL